MCHFSSCHGWVHKQKNEPAVKTKLPPAVGNNPTITITEDYPDWYDEIDNEDKIKVKKCIENTVLADTRGLTRERLMFRKHRTKVMTHIGQEYITKIGFWNLNLSRAVCNLPLLKPPPIELWTFGDMWCQPLWSVDNT